ncbi:ABC transporter substrate-binding protein [Bradyrhizobium genosp. P]|uniref:ABC transporter substrate-binding protein n=1 Tax=Bradyrhizobium genosp. P TaxID=83641 RepID=UPI003CEDA663
MPLATIEGRSSGLRFAAAIAIIVASSSIAVAQKKYDAGASDTEIKIGNIMPYSGPASAYGVMGKTEAAYFDKINAEGGVNGRIIKFISYDDSYSPPKAVEQARKLVESDEVLLVFGPLGTSSNSAIQKYLNGKKVPQLFVSSGASKWNDPQHFPWTMGWQPSYQSEGRVFAKYVLKEKPGARIGVLYQNDDFGKEYLKGLKDGLGAKAHMIAAEESYDAAEPTIDSHLAKLKASGADVFISFTTPKFAAQAIKKIAELEWRPIQLLAGVSVSVGAVIKPAGFENAQGILSVGYIKDPSDPRWENDSGIKKFNAFFEKYAPPGTNRNDGFVAYSYSVAQTLVKVLEMCGDDLTRDNVMRQAANLKGFVPDTVLPGITLNTSPTDFAPMKQLQVWRFKGETWEPIGGVISADLSE